MNETLDTLRTELFKALRGLGNRDEPLEIERARAIAEVGQVIINSAKVEVDHARVTNGKGSGFFPEAPALPGDTEVVEQRPGLRITKHTLRG